MHEHASSMPGHANGVHALHISKRAKVATTSTQVCLLSYMLCIQKQDVCRLQTAPGGTAWRVYQLCCSLGGNCVGNMVGNMVCL